MDDGRDRYVDLLRVMSLGVVVLGHWLMAVVVAGRGGAGPAGHGAGGGAGRRGGTRGLSGAAAVAVDVARFGFGVPLVGYANVAFVWLAVHQVGFLYADGRLRGWIGPAMAVGGLAATVALTSVGGYPVSMVGVPGEPVSNM